VADAHAHARAHAHAHALTTAHALTHLHARTLARTHTLTHEQRRSHAGSTHRYAITLITTWVVHGALLAGAPALLRLRQRKPHVQHATYNMLPRRQADQHDATANMSHATGRRPDATGRGQDATGNDAKG
jgi:hypothetical protein